MFFNSKMDKNKDENLKDLDTKNDLFLNKFMKVASSNSVGFNSSNENSLQNMPFVQKQQQKEDEKNNGEKIEINYEDMEIESRNNNIDENNNNNEEKVEKPKEVKKMIIIQRKDNIQIEKEDKYKDKEKENIC